MQYNNQKRKGKNAEISIISEIKKKDHHHVQSKISKQSINELCDAFFTFDLFLL